MHEPTVGISIHALREEGDPSNLIPQILQVHFYPRPPRGGRRFPRKDRELADELFLSTPSARRATAPICNMGEIQRYFYPRPPRGGRPSMPSPALILPGVFLSTPSARRATRTARPKLFFVLISIHALREEGDFGTHRQVGVHTAFLSTPSARRATDRSISVYSLSSFLSTPSARRATGQDVVSSIRTEFLSTPSARRATSAAVEMFFSMIFLSTPSARRATAKTEKNISAFVSL